LLRFEEKSLLPPDHNDTGVALNNLAPAVLVSRPLCRRRTVAPAQPRHC
jgi:hypothetical protein